MYRTNNAMAILIMSDCIFCKIIRGDLPSYKIYEDEFVYAFLDIIPVNKGHILVVPKEHHENILDTPEELLCKIIETVKNIAPIALKAVGSEGFNLNVNNGAIAGQIVSHLHFHIIPRFQHDGHQLFQGGAYESGEAEKIQEEILKLLENMQFAATLKNI